MKKSEKWVLAAVIFVLALVLASVLYQNLMKNYRPGADISVEEGTGESERPKVALRDFTVKTADGQEVTLSEKKGKPIFLNFWASKCSPCRMEMPGFQKLYEKYKDQVEFFMVDAIGALGETEEAGKAYIEENGFTFPVYYDTEGEAAVQYGITSIPTTFLIDEEGFILLGLRGMMEEEQAEKYIRELIQE